MITLRAALASFNPLYGAATMITGLSRNDAPSAGSKLTDRALMITRVSVIAMMAVLMPLTFGGWQKPIVTEAALAQSFNTMGSMPGVAGSPAIGNSPINPGTVGTPGGLVN